jgi:hypothetical protein
VGLNNVFVSDMVAWNYWTVEPNFLECQIWKVHASEVSRRIADAFGTKLGSRIQEAIDLAINVSVKSGSTRKKGRLLWHIDMESAVLRDRSGLPSGSRKLELIPTEEVAIGVHRIVSGAYGRRFWLPREYQFGGT